MRGIAFVLACLTVCLLWAGYNSLVDRSDKSLQVWVGTTGYDDPIGDQKVKAIEGLKLPNTTVTKMVVPKDSIGNFVWGILVITVLYAFITGLIIFFFKLYCRWFGTTPQL